MIKKFMLDDYVNKGIMTLQQKEILLNGIFNKKNILIIGEKNTGKTTLLNTFINEIASIKDRVIILENIPKIQSRTENSVCMKTTDYINMKSLLKISMNYRPDRIIIGEINSREALDLLTAWNTGHSGGISTIISDTMENGLKQLEKYIQLESISKQQELIAMTVNYLVFTAKENNIYKIKSIKKLCGFENGKYILEEIK